MQKDLKIKRIQEESEEIGNFINREFVRYGRQNNIALNYDEFCFIAEDDNGLIAGAITGRAYYDEVHIGDLIIGEAYRRIGLGSRLVGAVEEAYKNKGYDKITLTTFGFQAPDFYKKLGYSTEYMRTGKDPKLNKYFMVKKL